MARAGAHASCLFGCDRLPHPQLAFRSPPCKASNGADEREKSPSLGGMHSFGSSRRECAKLLGLMLTRAQLEGTFSPSIGIYDFHDRCQSLRHPNCFYLFGMLKPLRPAHRPCFSTVVSSGQAAIPSFPAAPSCSPLMPLVSRRALGERPLSTTLVAIKRGM